MTGHQDQFVLEFALEIVKDKWPSELPYLNTVVDELRRSNYQLPTGANDDTPMGIGGDDIVRALQSPMLVAILASLWSTLVAPIAKDLISRRIGKSASASPTEKLEAKRAAKQQIRDYLLKQGSKLHLSTDESDRLADRIVLWLERHPDLTSRLTK